MKLGLSCPFVLSILLPFLKSGLKYVSLRDGVRRGPWEVVIHLKCLYYALLFIFYCLETKRWEGKYSCWRRLFFCSSQQRIRPYFAVGLQYLIKINK